MTGFVRFRAIKITPNELAPGDLFSIAGPEYWETEQAREGIGTKVFIYTGRAPHNDDEAQFIYRIMIERPPYPFCHMPEKCMKSNRCEAEVCCND